MKTKFMVALFVAIASVPSVGAAQQLDMSSVNNLYTECIEIWKQNGDCEVAQPIASGGGS